MNKKRALVIASALLVMLSALSACRSKLQIDHDYRLKNADGEITVRFARVRPDGNTGRLWEYAIGFWNDGQTFLNLEADVWQVVREDCSELRVFIKRAPSPRKKVMADGQTAERPFELPENSFIGQHLHMSPSLPPESGEAFVLGNINLDLDEGYSLQLQWLN